MGTEYGFGEVGDNRTRISVYEMSGVFSLYAELSPERTSIVRDETTGGDNLQRDGSAQITLADKMTAAELCKMGAAMIQTASYWGHAEDLRPLLDELKRAAPELFR